MLPTPPRPDQSRFVYYFSCGQTWVIGLCKSITKIKCPSCYLLGVYDIHMTSLVILTFITWLWKCLPSFSTAKLLFPSFSETLSLAYPQRRRRKELCSFSMRVEYKQNFWNSSTRGTCLYLCSIIYISLYHLCHICVLIYIYFILCL